MAKNILDTIVAVGGISGEYEALTETEIAAAPGAAYAPPEPFDNFRVVASRVVQLLGGAPWYFQSFQTSAFTLRVPKGDPGTSGEDNDATDGRIFIIANASTATGDMTVETYDGVSTIVTLSPGDAAIVIHGDSDDWIAKEIGSGTRLLGYRYNSTGGVPGAGTRYLQAGDVATSVVGDQLALATTLVGVSVRVGVVDLSRSYTLEILSSPSSSPSVIASLSLPTNTISAIDFSLNVAISSNTEIGARVVRATGGGSSTFNNIVAHIWLEA